MRKALSAAVVLALAGCGGGEPPAEAWANDVCSSLNTWRGEIEGIASDLQSQLTSPGEAGAVISDAVDQGVEATQALVDDLRALGPPETEAGDQIEQELEDLADRVSEDVEEARAKADEIPESGSVSSVLGSLQEMAGSLESAVTDTRTTIEEIQSLDTEGELRDGFESAEACKELRGAAESD